MRTEDSLKHQEKMKEKLESENKPCWNNIQMYRVKGAKGDDAMGSINSITVARLEIPLETIHIAAAHRTPA